MFAWIIRRMDYKGRIVYSMDKRTCDVPTLVIEAIAVHENFEDDGATQYR